MGLIYHGTMIHMITVKKLYAGANEQMGVEVEK